ncbi:AmmeMemoRadiSam system protein A [Salidesulfovibrio onnuriiensis]|uniref:AmmeMemoRadiSam system protein A n=1 Tax=Salidesulfovibrio onnuriiensis TaxID=2583823 RepID=UPI0011C8591D|nr:AmmeMemoRadiSam system protein A [Salidesulfovibrio onnuriiensis]
MSGFHLSLNDEEKHSLMDLVKDSIQSYFNGEHAEPPTPETKTLQKELGAFVTLKIDGHLRGCIGNVQGNGPVYRTIWNMARSAAFNDPRFPELTPDEFARVDIEISILGPISECHHPGEIKVGRHGLIIARGGQSGLLLPQVPVEWGWDRETFLRQTCRKAGLAEDSWNKAGTTIFWFEAVVF